MCRRAAVSMLLFLTPIGCLGPKDTYPGPEPKPRLFDGMGTHQRKITTTSRDAQEWFNQALVWAYSFNHDEAIRSFAEAGRLDVDAAMPWWGVAYCNGPHINNPIVDEAHASAAWDALQKALARRDEASPVERALIDALAKRYAHPQPADRRPLDEAYAAAMGAVWQAHRDDADVGTLYAESLMDLQPWDLWNRDGTPKGRTTEILAVLEEVLAKSPNHPGANHLYIHAVEAGPHPEKGVASADRLRTAVPAAGHMVHMPSHIDVQVGQWAKAADQNVQAIEADRKYRSMVPRQQFYRVYMAHNHQFLSFAAMMEGRSAVSIQAAREMVAGVPPEWAKANAALVDGVLSTPIDALKRFGRWDEVLREPKPAECFPIAVAMWHYARGVALAAKGKTGEAESEQAQFRAAVKRVPEDAMMMINKAHKTLAIAEHVLAGEIAYRRGSIDEAVRQLEEGARKEDDLLYMEPPEWIQPVRHTLGAILISAGRHADAERVYREDLAAWPENGWSLFGLAQALRGQNRAQEAAAVEARFKRQWTRADVQIGSSCLCVPGGKG